MGNIQLKSQARKMVREAQARANEERAQRDRANVDDMATFLVARTRLAGVDEWQAERVAHIGLDADRRRDEHRSEGAAAIGRIKGRGETIASIAALANISESEVRSYLKAASAAGRAQGGGAAQVAAPQALGGADAEERRHAQRRRVCPAWCRQAATVEPITPGPTTAMLTPT
jgi:hypothetical protein